MDQPAPLEKQINPIPNPHFKAGSHFSKYFIMGTILLIIFIGFSTFYVLNIRKNSLPTQPILTRISPTPTNPTPTPTPVDTTAKWKTFEDPLHRFSFQYPSTSAPDKSLTRPGFVYIVADASKTPWKQNFIFNLSVSPNLNNLTTKEIVEDKIQNIRNDKNAPWAKEQANKMDQTLKAYSNNWVQGIKLQTFFEGYPSGFGEVIMVNGKEIYDFFIHDGNGEVYEEQEKLLDQILSTFKFTNTQTSLSPSPTSVTTHTPSSGNQICSTNADCSSGETCETWGPIPANGSAHKYCTAPSQAVPMTQQSS